MFPTIFSFLPVYLWNFVYPTFQLNGEDPLQRIYLFFFVSFPLHCLTIIKWVVSHWFGIVKVLILIGVFFLYILRVLGEETKTLIDNVC